MADQHSNVPEVNQELEDYISRLYRNVPKDIRTCPHWVVWRYEKRKGSEKPAKVPYFPREGRRADITNADDLIGLGAAVSYLRASHQTESPFDGVGFALTADDQFAGIDLDHCRDPQTCEIEGWALDIINRLAGYTEVSPSGTGIRIFIWATLEKGHKIGDVEVYFKDRYLTVTGSHVEGTPETIEERQAEVEALVAEIQISRHEAAEAALGAGLTKKTCEINNDRNNLVFQTVSATFGVSGGRRNAYFFTPTPVRRFTRYGSQQQLHS